MKSLFLVIRKPPRDSDDRNLQSPTNRFGSKGTPGHTPLSHTPDIPKLHNPPNVAEFQTINSWVGGRFGYAKQDVCWKVPTDRTRNLRLPCGEKRLPAGRCRKDTEAFNGSMALAGAVRMLRWWWVLGKPDV